MTDTPQKDLEFITLTIEKATYGKRVQFEGGPIIPGFDHAITSETKGFSHCLRKFVTPNTLEEKKSTRQILHRDSTQQGALFLWPYQCDPDNTYMLLGRIRAASEMGKGVEGRLYTQMSIHVVEMKDWIEYAGHILLAGRSSDLNWLQAKPDVGKHTKDDERTPLSLKISLIPSLSAESPIPDIDDKSWKILYALQQSPTLQSRFFGEDFPTPDNFLESLALAVTLLPHPLRQWVTATSGFSEHFVEFGAQHTAEPRPIELAQSFSATPSLLTLVPGKILRFSEWYDLIGEYTHVGNDPVWSNTQRKCIPILLKNRLDQIVDKKQLNDLDAFLAGHTDTPPSSTKDADSKPEFLGHLLSTIQDTLAQTPIKPIATQRALDLLCMLAAASWREVWIELFTKAKNATPELKIYLQLSHSIANRGRELQTGSDSTNYDPQNIISRTKFGWIKLLLYLVDRYMQSSEADQRAPGYLCLTDTIAAHQNYLAIHITNILVYDPFQITELRSMGTSMLRFLWQPIAANQRVICVKILQELASALTIASDDEQPLQSTIRLLDEVFHVEFSPVKMEETLSQSDLNPLLSSYCNYYLKTCISGNQKANILWRQAFLISFKKQATLALASQKTTDIKINRKILELYRILDKRYYNHPAYPLLKEQLQTLIQGILKSPESLVLWLCQTLEKPTQADHNNSFTILKDHFRTLNKRLKTVNPHFIVDKLWPVLKERLYKLGLFQYTQLHDDLFTLFNRLFSQLTTTGFSAKETYFDITVTADDLLKLARNLPYCDYRKIATQEKVYADQWLSAIEYWINDFPCLENNQRIEDSNIQKRVRDKLGQPLSVYRGGFSNWKDALNNVNPDICVQRGEENIIPEWSAIKQEKLTSQDILEMFCALQAWKEEYEYHWPKGDNSEKFFLLFSMRCKKKSHEILINLWRYVIIDFEQAKNNIDPEVFWLVHFFHGLDKDVAPKDNPQQPVPEGIRSVLRHTENTEPANFALYLMRQACWHNMGFGPLIRNPLESPNRTQFDRRVLRLNENLETLPQARLEDSVYRFLLFISAITRETYDNKGNLQLGARARRSLAPRIPVDNSTITNRLTPGTVTNYSTTDIVERYRIAIDQAGLADAINQRMLEANFKTSNRWPIDHIQYYTS